MQVNYPLIIWLATKELIIAIQSKHGVENKWDFPRLVILLSLIMSLSFFAVGMQHGLSNRFAAVLLGELPGSGIPIWLNANILDGGSGIDKQAIIEASTRYKFHPYEDVDASNFRLPSCDTNDNRPYSNTTCKLWQPKLSNKAIFSGIAVFSDDPLWKYAFPYNAEHEQINLSIVLSKKKFKENFDFDAYKNEMETRLPTKYKNELPTSQEEFFSDAGQKGIWVSLGRSPEMRLLVKMRVKWISHIPTQGDHAFLLPMEIYKTLELSKYGNINNSYYPQSFSDLYTSTVRVRAKNNNLDFNNLPRCKSENSESILPEDINTTPSIKYKQLANCLQQISSKGKGNKGEVIFRKTDNICMNSRVGELLFIDYRLGIPKPDSWIQECLSQYNIKKCDSSEGLNDDLCTTQIEHISDKYISVDYIRNSDGIYQYNITAGAKKEIKNRTKVTNQNTNVNEKEKDISNNNELTKFNHAFIYINDINTLSSSIKELKSLPNKPFNFHDMYEDSLKRFNILQEILKILGNFNYTVMLCFSITLLVIKLWIIIDHRKKNYVTYMAKGISLTNIQALVSFQVIITSLAALFFSFILTKSFSLIMSYLIREKLTPYQDMLTNTHIDLLPVEWHEYGIVFALAVAISTLASLFILRFVLTKKS
ncbi:hypothetical protein KKC91_01185 [bacterium]|nr:hypothetical protein [bacterium]